MAKRGKSTSQTQARLELMKVAGDTRMMGTNFHIYVRNRMPSIRTLPEVDNDLWNKVQYKLESSFEWLPEHRFVWNELDHVGRPYNHYGIHLKGGVTCYRSDANKNVEVIFDCDSDREITDEVIGLVSNEEHKPKNRVGLIQMSYGTLNVKFVEYRPYEFEITPFLGEEIAALKQEMLQSFHDVTNSGLYLIHGKPGTGKTSFLKEVLYQTDKQALFIPPSIAGELSNPNLISLLMDHADSILIIEDAETILMKREADNSDAVSNLLNLTDGFPSDFLNLNVICTFNTSIEDIDPALLRKGRLKGIQEFKEMDIEHGRKLAEMVGSDVEIDRKMTVAEICNTGPKCVVKKSHKVGYN